MNLNPDAERVLQETSRTFYLPIMTLPTELRSAVGASYLCFRAIDEIEDHPNLSCSVKSDLLSRIALLLQTRSTALDEGLQDIWGSHADQLPEVSLRLSEWMQIAPRSIQARLGEAVSAMSDRMAFWVRLNWMISSQEDLAAYTYAVAGAVGIWLSDCWAWFDGTRTDRHLAVAYGRGLQCVNILRNTEEDAKRGVSFFPGGWTVETMRSYARDQLKAGERYYTQVQGTPADNFCRIPLRLAQGTLSALEEGRSRLSRTEVLALVAAENC